MELWTSSDLFILIWTIIFIVACFRFSSTDFIKTTDHLLSNTNTVPTLMIVVGVAMLFYGWIGWVNTYHHKSEPPSFEYPPTVLAGSVLFSGIAILVLGIINLCEFLYPTFTTRKDTAECEENPQFSEKLAAALKRVGELARTEAFSKGKPICYIDKDNKVVWEYPDGTISGDHTPP